MHSLGSNFCAVMFPFFVLKIFLKVSYISFNLMIESRVRGKSSKAKNRTRQQRVQKDDKRLNIHK